MLYFVKFFCLDKMCLAVFKPIERSKSVGRIFEKNFYLYYDVADNYLFFIRFIIISNARLEPTSKNAIVIRTALFSSEII